MKKSICFFAVKIKNVNKTNSFVRFFGESTARQSAFGFIWPLAWINNWDNSLDEQMDRTCEEIMTTSSGTGNGKRICDEKWWLFSWIYVLLSNNRTIVHTTIYTTLSIKTITV